MRAVLKGCMWLENSSEGTESQSFDLTPGDTVMYVMLNIFLNLSPQKMYNFIQYTVYHLYALEMDKIYLVMKPHEH